MINMFAYIRYFPVVFLYLLQRGETRKCIDEDINATKRSSFLEAFRSNVGFRNLFYARVKQNFFWRICTWIARPYPQIEVWQNDGIGKGMTIYHNSGCVINAGSIGEHCYVYQGVTIGKGHQTENGNRPIIGDRVRICTNAVVLGGVCIGDDAIVGANAFVNKDVPPRAVVGGVPARVLYYRDLEEIK